MIAISGAVSPAPERCPDIDVKGVRAFHLKSRWRAAQFPANSASSPRSERMEEVLRHSRATASTRRVAVRALADAHPCGPPVRSRERCYAYLTGSSRSRLDEADPDPVGLALNRGDDRRLIEFRSAKWSSSCSLTHTNLRPVIPSHVSMKIPALHLQRIDMKVRHEHVARGYNRLRHIPWIRPSAIGKFIAASRG
jgi:hypothetical protein